MPEELANARVATGEESTSLRRLTQLVFLAALLLYLPFGRAHFTGTDEVAQFEMTRAIAERGALDVGPLMHTEVGRGGQRYSFFAVGQAVLALPLFVAADLAEAVLPHAWSVAIAGPLLRDERHVFGGDLAHSFAMFYPPLVTALLVAIFFRFELALGVSRRSALVVSLLFASTTYALVMSTYFLRHGTVACAMLGSFYCFFRWRERGRTRDLLLGSALASGIPLVRVPAAVIGPALAGYLAHAIARRSDGLADRAAALRAVGIALLPFAAAVLLHVAFNFAKWGTLFESPMVGQRAEFSNPLWVGVRGYLFSPGLSVFVYSPLLLLTPFALRAFWRKWPAEATAFVAVALLCLLFHSKFDRWTGLWSAPGPRYLFLAVPLLLLPLGVWIDAGAQRAKWLAVAPLALLGAWVQVATTLVAWSAVPRLAGYPAEPDSSDFLLQVDRSPVLVMTRLLFDGGPFDPWLIQLGQGWKFFPGAPGVALGLLLAWATGFALCMLALRREMRRLEDAQPGG